MIFTLVLAISLVFIVVTVLPGDPVRGLFGPKPPPERYYNAIVEQFHLDEPLPKQYVLYVRDMLTGDWGRGFPVDPYGDASEGPAVRDVVSAAAPVSGRLVLATLLVQGLVGVTAGALAALRPGKVSALVYAVALLLVSVPAIVVAYVSRRIFGIELTWLPVTGVSAGWTSYLLPTLSMATISTGYVMLLVRSSLADGMRAPWIVAARGRGLRQARLVRHALRPSLVPVVTFLAVSVGQLVTALIIVEGIFGMPGIGGQLVRSIQQHDRALIVGLVTVLVGAVIVASAVVDVLYGLIDPRIAHATDRRRA